MKLRLKTDLLLLWMFATIEALLLARLVLKLFAARPDHPVVVNVFAITMPLITPLTILDAGQPAFGAVLEFSTLVLVFILPVIWIGLCYSQRRLRATQS
jgi:uncharacterized protein YggT (Ycf19 family)